MNKLSLNLTIILAVIPVLFGAYIFISIFLYQQIKEDILTLQLEKNANFSWALSEMSSSDFSQSYYLEMNTMVQSFSYINPDIVYLFFTNLDNKIVVSLDRLFEGQNVEYVDLLAEKSLIRQQQVTIYRWEAFIDVFLEIHEVVLNKRIKRRNDIWVRGEHLFETRQELFFDSQKLGYLTIGISQKQLNGQLNSLLIQIITIGFILLFLIIIVIHIVIKMLTTPLRTLTNEISKINNSNNLQEQIISMSIKEQQGTLEILELRDAFLTLQENLIYHFNENIRLSKLKDEFLANTSHELRTPLNGIIGLASAMKQIKDPQSKQFQGNLSLILSSARRLSLLVNDILDFSKMKYEEVSLYRKPVSLNIIVESVLALSQTLIKEKPIQLLNLVSQKTIPLILADQDRLEQILYNLVNNAIKFTDRGEVIVFAQQKEQQVIIQVIDTGRGIPREKQTSIFNAFEQLDDSSTQGQEGTGLGLSIVKQLVELHEGTVTVESQENQGSTFTIALPIAEAPIEATAPHPSILNETKEPDPLPLSALLLSPTLKGFQDILIVDDNPINIEAVVQQLPSNHYTIRVANSGRQALERCEEKIPDLILLDVMMPGMSGFSVCEQLRHHYNRDWLPILFLTAKNQEKDILQGFEVGGNDYLTKPFFHTELICRIEAHLEITLHRKCDKALIELSSRHYVSQEEIIVTAFEQITQLSFVDEAVLFKDNEVLHRYQLDGEGSQGKLEKAPSKSILKIIDSYWPHPNDEKKSFFQYAPVVLNSLDGEHLLGHFYQAGHFIIVRPPQLQEYLMIFFRLPQRNSFQKIQSHVYIQSMLNQIQTTQHQLQKLLDDDALVKVIGQIQPRLFEITYIKSTAPTLEIHFSSDKRPLLIDGCSMEKLSLYFKESKLLRVHKSYLVNPLKVTGPLQSINNFRDYQLPLVSQQVVPIGRTYLKKIRHFFAKSPAIEN